MENIDVWQLWLIASIICLIIEFANAGIGVICFAVGALSAALVSAFDLGIAWQIGTFTVGSLLSFIFIVPLIKKYVESKNSTVKTNLDNMVGRTAKVIEPCSADGGRVSIDGMDWRATTIGDEAIEVGSAVTIKDRKGNTLVVE